MRPITRAGFEAKFADSADPWRTFSDRDEAHKRDAVLHALSSATFGRILELGAGNGSNSVALAARALRLDATEGTGQGTALVAKALSARPRACAGVLQLPARFPRPSYDAIVVAELLYYLSARDMARVARDVGAALPPGGRLVLAHHRIDFPDFAQHAHAIHDRFLRDTRVRWRVLSTVRTGRWLVQGVERRATGA